MKHKFLIPLLPLLGALVPVPMPATQSPSSVSAPTATGILEGRVKNAVTGRYVGKARVAITQSDHVTFTDEAGHYRLTHVPSGPVVIDDTIYGMTIFPRPDEMLAVRSLNTDPVNAADLPPTTDRWLQSGGGVMGIDLRQAG